MKQLLFQGFLAVAQVLDLDLLPPRKFELTGVGHSQLRPQFMEQVRRFLLQVLAVRGQPRQIGLGLAIDVHFLVDGFDFGRAGNQALRHGQGRDQSVEPRDFRQGVLLGLPGRFQP